jgi:CheY-like chemotaxis protein
MSEGREVLVVDDDPAVREALEHVLHRAGYAVRVVSGAAQAMVEYRDRRPALVITDVVMPGIDGVALIRALRAEFPSARIIAVSGGGRVAEYLPHAISTSSFLKAAEQAGADLTITKPFERRELFAALDRLLVLH